MGCGPGAGRDPGSTGGLGRDGHPGATGESQGSHGRGVGAHARRVGVSGFDVQITASTPGADPRASLEQTASGNNVDAVVALLGDVSPGSVEVWVIDRVTGKSVVRRHSQPARIQSRGRDSGHPGDRASAGQPAGNRHGRQR